MLALAVVLLTAPQIFVLAPLAGLLAVSRPRSFRAWGWLAASGGGVAAWLLQPDGLFRESLTAWAVLVAGAFVVLSLLPPQRLLSRSVLAVVLGSVGLFLLGIGHGITWRGLELLAARDLAAMFAEQARTLEAQVDGWSAGAQLFRALQAESRSLAALLPGALVLLALAGLGLAWRWHQVVADAPLPPPGERFAAFTFGDGWVWVLVVALATVLVSVPASAPATLGANALLVMSGLYAARGLAIVRWALQQAPLPMIIALGLVGLALFVFTLSGLMVLGVADTWLDARRLAPASLSGGE